MTIRFNSESPHAFLKKLPDEDVWMSMYKLFRDSTFCFLKVNGRDTNYRTLHNDANIFCEMDTLTGYRYPFWGFGHGLIYNKNVYNTDERGYKFRGW